MAFLPRISCLYLVALALLFPPAADIAQARVVATKSYSYFDVHGRTADDLDAELGRRGPSAEGSSARHPGATRIRFGGDATYVDGGGRCRVGDTRVTVHTQIILPRWKNRRAARPELSLIWDTLAADIKRHEERHADTARQQAQKMESEILALPPQRDCESMQRLVTDVSNRGIEDHDALQARFDRIEAVNFQDRMMRLLGGRLRKSGG